MFARVTTVRLPVGTSAARLLRFHEKLLPALKRKPGFCKYMALVNNKSGKAMAIVFWDSEADMHASEAEADRSRAAVLSDLAGEDPTVEEYEIAYQV